jgi:fibronectin type 3 domain-containing protein
METKRFTFTAFIITMFVVMFMTACNLFLHEENLEEGKKGGTVLIPGTPSGVTAAAASSSSIALGWNSVSGASGYYVYRSSSSSGTYYYVGSSSSTSYTDTGLSANTTYYYKVKAYNKAGTGYQSSSVHATTLSGGGGTAPNAPTVTATASGNSITLNWTVVPGATGYKVYRNTIDSYSETNVVATPTSTSYTDTGLAAGTPYFYRVTAYNDAGESPKSSPAVIIGIGNANHVRR